jgi:hypothetical protein
MNQIHINVHREYKSHLLVMDILFNILKVQTTRQTGNALNLGEENTNAQILNSGIDGNNMWEIQSDSLISIHVTQD